MPIVADGAVRVGADLAPFNRELNRGLGQAEQRAQTFGQKVNAALSPRNLAAGLGVAFGASQVASFFSDAIQAAGEFEDSVSATGVIFGEEAIPALQEWADEAHSAFGASKQDALAAANQFAVFGKSAGLVGNDLTDFSTKLVQLGGDLASMFGGRTEDAIAAVGSALRGEFEPIRAYGVLLDDATLRQQAFEMGLISTTKNALTPQQRVLAAQASIFAQTSDAQGDFARTSDGLMNTQRDLAAELENVSIEVGEEMLPIMLSLVTFLKDEGIPIMREFIGLLDFGDAGSAEGIPILGEIEAALNSTNDAALVFGDMIRFQENAVGQAAEAIGVDYMTMHTRIKRIMDTLAIDHQTAIDYLVNGLPALPEQTNLAVSAAVAAWKENDLGQAVADAADVIPAELQEASDEAVAIAGKLPGALADVLEADIEDYQAALDELAEVAVNSVSDMTERQEIEGVLGSKALTDALNSDSTRTRLLAQQFVADRIAEYELLAPGALAAGELVVPALSEGVLSNIDLAIDAGQTVVNAAGEPLVDTQWATDAGFNTGKAWADGLLSASQYARISGDQLAFRAGPSLRGESPPKEGPLKDIDKWGLNIGRAWAKGWLGAIPDVRGATLALAGAAALDVPLSGMGAMNAGTMGATSGGVTYVLNVNGVPRAFNSRTDFMNALDDLGSFGDGRL